MEAECKGPGSVLGSARVNLRGSDSGVQGLENERPQGGDEEGPDRLSQGTGPSAGVLEGRVGSP